MLRTILCVITTVSVAATACYGDVAQVTHEQFQAVDSEGKATYDATSEVILEGIVLNQSANRHNPVPDDSIYEDFNLGAQWEIFVQGEGSDHAGTAVWLGQLYDNLPWIQLGERYSNQQFIDELARINSQQFGIGDRIRVRGVYMDYKGKHNVNEQHHTANDFHITLLEKGAELPRPEVVTLAQLKDEHNDPNFDQTRQTGCEHYQGRLIKIEDVNFVDPQLWAPLTQLEITDGIKTFPVFLGRGNGIYKGSNNLSEPFDVIGIMDQESSDQTTGYQILVLDYDGNGQVLAQREHRRADRPADVNLDGIVDMTDLAKLAQQWLN